MVKVLTCLQLTTLYVMLLQVVDCAWPGAICEDGTQPDISPFRCCPFCLSEGKLINLSNDITRFILMLYMSSFVAYSYYLYSYS